MVILALDSCLSEPSVALYLEGKLAGLKKTEPQRAVENLIDLSVELLRQHDVEFKQLSYVAATIGPGGFTAARLALVAALGIAFANKTPTCAITTLELLAFAQMQKTNKENLLVNIQAGRGQIYTQKFSFKNNLPVAITEAQLVDENLNNINDENFYNYKPLIDKADAADLARLVDVMLQNGAEINPLTTPLHLREADAKPAKPPVVQAC